MNQLEISQTLEKVATRGCIAMGLCFVAVLLERVSLCLCLFLFLFSFFFNILGLKILTGSSHLLQSAKLQISSVFVCFSAESRGAGNNADGDYGSSNAVFQL